MHHSWVVVQASLRGRPGASYVDIPSNILMAQLPPGAALAPAASSSTGGSAAEGGQLPAEAEASLPFAVRLQPDAAAVAQVAALLRTAQR